MRSNWLNACSLNKKNFINWFFEQKYSPFLPCSSLFRSLSQCWFMSSSMHFIQSTRKDFHLELPGSTKRRPWNNVMALVHFHSVSIFNYTISKLLSAERTFSKKKAGLSSLSSECWRSYSNLNFRYIFSLNCICTFLILHKRNNENGSKMWYLSAEYSKI